MIRMILVRFCGGFIVIGVSYKKSIFLHGRPFFLLAARNKYSLGRFEQFDDACSAQRRAASRLSRCPAY